MLDYAVPGEFPEMTSEQEEERAAEDAAQKGRPPRRARRVPGSALAPHARCHGTDPGINAFFPEPYAVQSTLRGVVKKLGEKLLINAHNHKPS